MTNKEICKECLEILLDKEIGDITYLENEKEIDIGYRAKSVRLDILLKDGTTSFNLEMQATNKFNIPKRSRYYNGSIDLGDLEKGKYYGELKDTYVIFICTFDLFGLGLPRYTFENVCLEDNNLKLNDGSYKIFFNTRAFDKEKSKARDLLAYFNGEMLSSSIPIVDKIEELVVKIRKNEQWESDYMKYNADMQAHGYANRQEGIEIGIEQGIGIGKLEEKFENARSLLGVLGIEQISKSLKIPLREVQHLYNEKYNVNLD